MELARRTLETQQRLFELKTLMASIKHRNEICDIYKEATQNIKSLMPGICEIQGMMKELRAPNATVLALMDKLLGRISQISENNSEAVKELEVKSDASFFIDMHFVRRKEINDTSHQVMSQERTTIRHFLICCGDRPFATYRRGDITTFLAKIRRLPSVYGRSPADADLNIDQIIERAEKNNLSRVSDKTAKRHLSALSQFFQFAVDVGELTATEKNNMFDGHTFKNKKSAKDERDAWPPEQLTKLFSSPVWRGCEGKHARSKPGTNIIRDSRFWLPLLALYHGARLEEFADLYRRDIVCDDGTWAFNITTIEENPDEPQDEGRRRLKNQNAQRTIPVHPEILKLGFLHYISDVAPVKGDPLFPDLLPQGKDRRRGPRITRWFVEYRKSIGIYQPEMAMHSFRHNANTRLRDTISGYQQNRHVNYLLGHSPGSGEGEKRYDKGPGLKAAAQTLGLLKYPELDLTKLYID